MYRKLSLNGICEFISYLPPPRNEVLGSFLVCNIALHVSNDLHCIQCSFSHSQSAKQSLDTKKLLGLVHIISASERCSLTLLAAVKRRGETYRQLILPRTAGRRFNTDIRFSVHPPLLRDHSYKIEILLFLTYSRPRSPYFLSKQRIWHGAVHK